MIIPLPPNQPAVAITPSNMPKTCGNAGVIIQSLDSNGKPFISSDQQSLNSLGPVAQQPSAGLLLQFQTSVTNAPSMIIIAPFSGTLYARNWGNGITYLSVEVFSLGF